MESTNTKQELHISQLVRSQDGDKTIINFNQVTTKGDVETGRQDNCTLVISADDSIEVALRKIADDTVEIFLDGDSIGFGALNGGEGMSPDQLERSAETPEADAHIASEE